MKYTLTETVNTIGWSDGINQAPADLVKAAKEMLEKGEVVIFGKVDSNLDTKGFHFALLTINQSNQLTIIKRDPTIVITG